MTAAAATTLPAADAERVRDGVAAAIVGGPDGLRRTLQSDPASFLSLVAAANVGAEEADRLLHQAVLGARQSGHSWEAIGGLLGVSRQAAQQRFAARATDLGPGTEETDRRVITGVTAFTEMGALAAAGRTGFHLVDFGPFYLVTERSAHQWEHRRVTLPSRSARRRLEDEGWLDAGTWFPFRYFKRALDAPAEAAPASG